MIRTDRMTLIPEKTADAGGNAYMRMGLEKMVRNQKDLLGLTKLTPALTAGLVESAYKPVTTG